MASIGKYPLVELDPRLCSMLLIHRQVCCLCVSSQRLSFGIELHDSHPCIDIPKFQNPQISIVFYWLTQLTHECVEWGYIITKGNMI